MARRIDAVDRILIVRRRPFMSRAGLPALADGRHRLSLFQFQGYVWTLGIHSREQNKAWRRITDAA